MDDIFAIKTFADSNDFVDELSIRRRFPFDMDNCVALKVFACPYGFILELSSRRSCPAFTQLPRIGHL